MNKVNENYKNQNMYNETNNITNVILPNKSDILLKGIIYIIGYADDMYGSYRKTQPHIIHYTTYENHNGSIQLARSITDNFSDLLMKINIEVFSSDTSLIEKISLLYPDVDKNLIYGNCYDLNNYSSDNYETMPDITSEQIDEIIKKFNKEYKEYTITTYDLNAPILTPVDMEKRKAVKEKQLEEERLSIIQKEKEEAEYKEKQIQTLGSDVYNIKEIALSSDFKYSDLIEYLKGLFEKKEFKSFTITQQLFIACYNFDLLNEEEKENVEMFKSLFGNDLKYIIDLVTRYDRIELKFDGSDDIK